MISMVSLTRDTRIRVSLPLDIVPQVGMISMVSALTLLFRSFKEKWLKHGNVTFVMRNYMYLTMRN